MHEKGYSDHVWEKSSSICWKVLTFLWLRRRQRPGGQIRLHLDCPPPSSYQCELGWPISGLGMLFSSGRPPVFKVSLSSTVLKLINLVSQAHWLFGPKTALTKGRAIFLARNLEFKFTGHHCDCPGGELYAEDLPSLLDHPHF